MIFTKEILIRSVDEGMRQYASPQALSNYLEEIGGLHADLLGCGIQRLSAQNLTWVLVKMSIEYLQELTAGELCYLNTWPVTVEKLSFRRDFSLHKPDNSKALQAVSYWVLMNIKTRKIEKLPSWALQLRESCYNPEEKACPIQLPSLVNARESAHFTVRLSDIDQNFHVNNVRYLDFLQEASMYCLQLKLKEFSEKKLKRLDILYKAECFLKDEISVLSQSLEHCVENQYEILHSIVKKDSQQEVVRARTVWE